MCSLRLGPVGDGEMKSSRRGPCATQDALFLTSRQVDVAICCADSTFCDHKQADLVCLISYDPLLTCLTVRLLRRSFFTGKVRVV